MSATDLFSFYILTIDYKVASRGILIRMGHQLHCNKSATVPTYVAEGQNECILHCRDDDENDMPKETQSIRIIGCLHIP